jgi:hypothetical protein
MVDVGTDRYASLPGGGARRCWCVRDPERQDLYPKKPGGGVHSSGSEETRAMLGNGKD